MYKRYLLILLFIMSVSYYGCSQDHTDQTQTLATINDYRLSLKDFQRQLAEELELNPDAKLNNKVKKKFLEEIIRKQILIQEAKKMGLDQEEKFIRAIEYYWESILIKNLIELKGDEILQHILISEEEIKDYYNQMEKKSQEVLPLKQYRENIAYILKEQKKTRMMEEWTIELKEKSNIEINNELLYGS